jgi:hypothetical protein
VKKWTWEQIDASRSGGSGDLAKIFKNEEIVQPGILADSAPSARATLLVREVVQNSWDAARELRYELEAAGDRAPSFHIELVFRKAGGAHKARLSSELGLAELAARTHEFQRADLGLKEVDCLMDLNSTKPLNLLEIRERGSTGMYGPFSGARSKLYLALVSLGFTAKKQGAGGSFGYGKAGLIRGSAIHTIVAYTCFRERDDDPGVTRRLIGMTYWGLHSNSRANFSGYARMGRSLEPSVAVPFENGSADRMAAALGLEVRDPGDPSQLGTTFLLVEPTVGPDELVVAVERNWWPALQDRSFTASVITSAGKELHPKPKKDPVLRSFIDAYELAVGSDEPKVPEQARERFRTLTLSRGHKVKPGVLGLVADRNNWSYPLQSQDSLDEVQATSDRSLIALVRGPRMVVEYLDLGPSLPVIRGVFVADPTVDDLLRMTEPKAHDAWQTTKGDGIDDQGPTVAKAILRRIREKARTFRNGLKPPLPHKEQIRLPLLADLYRTFFDEGVGMSSSTPERDARLVCIEASQRVELDPAEPGLIRLVGSAKLNLSENSPTGESRVRVRVRYYFAEESRRGDRCSLGVIAPTGFEEDGYGSGEFSGVLTQSPVQFEFVSDSYSPDWSGHLVLTGEPMDTADFVNELSGVGGE